MFKKVLTSVVVIASLLVIQLPTASTAVAAQAKQEKKQKRKTRLVGPSVGKKVGRAFELYSADDIPGALVLLLDINAKKGYDKAYVDRFIAIMYATKGDLEKQAIKYLKLAIAPDILNENDQGEALKLLADLQMQTSKFKNALKNYKRWMDFTGKEDGATYVKIAQAYYSLKQLDKMIVPADKAIVLQKAKPNQNPYILKIQSYYERKMYKKAIKVLEQVVQVFPDKKQWWTRLGMFYMLTENYPKALATLDLAYKQGYLEKGSEIKTLANLYASNEIPYQSARILEKAIASGKVKRDDSTIARIANSWHAAQNIDKAAKYYGELAKMTGKAKHYRKQGMLLKQDEQFTKAIVAFKKALDLGSKNVGKIQMSLAESYFYLEKYKKSYAAIKKAMKDPKSRRAAKSWVSFIKDTALRKKVKL
ncbi:MAG: tetratricopeptide repeat protein [Alteromonadaceae bacterium]|nr:tetratricopeptide repeat protein [Alteromonadaceae bacterium]